MPHNTSTKHCLLATSNPFPKSFIGNYTRDEVFNEGASVKDIIAKKKKRKNGFPVVKIIATKAEHNKKKLIFFTPSALFEQLVIDDFSMYILFSKVQLKIESFFVTIFEPISFLILYSEFINDVTQILRFY